MSKNQLDQCLDAGLTLDESEKVFGVVANFAHFDIEMDVETVLAALAATGYTDWDKMNEDARIVKCWSI